MSLPQYEVSPYGFLPEDTLEGLPTPWHHLQPLVDNLSSLDMENFRNLVESLPEYSSEKYPITTLSMPEKRQLYTILTMIMQKYVWGCNSSNIRCIVPKKLGQPVLEVSKVLGLPPILTYAAVTLFNWSLRDQTKPMSVENLKVNLKLLDGLAFEWFCIIHTAIEARGGHAVKMMMDSKKYMKNHDHKALKAILKEIGDSIVDSNEILDRMYEHCSPEDFWRFRFYFEGTTDKTFFPNGLIIEGFENHPLVYRGSSGGQSPLIKAFDVFFSVKHEGHGKSFIEEMTSYIAPPHKKYLEDLGKGESLRDYVIKSKDEDLQMAYKEAVSRFVVYRQSHFRLVHDYVFKIVAKNKVMQKAQEPDAPVLYKENNVGTGGSDPQKFLAETVAKTKASRNFKVLSEIKDSLMETYREKGAKVIVKKLNTKGILDVLVSLLIALIGVYLVKLLC